MTLKKAYKTLIIVFILIAAAVPNVYAKDTFNYKKGSYLYINDLDVNSNESTLSKDNIFINYEQKPLKFTSPIILETNRYYIPLIDILHDLKINFILDEDTIYINSKTNPILLNIQKSYYTNGTRKNLLRVKLLQNKKIIYISLFDLTNILNLKTDWNMDNNTISLFNIKETLVPKKVISTKNPALIRLEDIVEGQRYNTAESLEKLRIVSDYLFVNNIPFHIAWVSRYVNPALKIDNNPAEQDSFYNADFIFTLDYFITKNGLIGLHGYTHQYADTESVIGKEFDSVLNATKEETIDRITCAINGANKLNIPISFFETPHYAATGSQHKIMEQYFTYLYEPQCSKFVNSIIHVTNNKKKTIYIPTPLGYVHNSQDAGNMIARIKNLPRNTIASFYFHPNLEFTDIKIVKDKSGYPSYTYSENSILHKIVKFLYSKGYTFVNIHYFK